MQKPIRVYKFGGVSLGSGERLAHILQTVQSHAQEAHLVLTVSAFSRGSKKEGTTNNLLAASTAARQQESFEPFLQIIHDVHHEVAELVLKGNPKLLEEANTVLSQELDHLRNILNALSTLEEVTTTAEDIIMGMGEKLSAILVSFGLRAFEVPSLHVDLSKVIERGDEVTETNFPSRLKARFHHLISPMVANQMVPVVTGYIGRYPGGILKHVGRGYTDFTASLVAAALKAEELHIWKDVDGIFTTDPNKVERAQLLSHLTPGEAAELTYFGSEVIHPYTMEQVISAQIPVRIRNARNPENPGTYIAPQSESQTPRIKSITAKQNITMLNICSNRMLNAYGFLAQIFRVFEDHGVVVDLVSTSEVNVSLTIDKTDQLGTLIPELEKLGEVTYGTDYAILSMVGEGIKTRVDIAGAMFKLLADSGIEVEMITQGASRINISCVIKNDKTERAIFTLHRHFIEKRQSIDSPPQE